MLPSAGTDPDGHIRSLAGPRVRPIGGEESYIMQFWALVPLLAEALSLVVPGGWVVGGPGSGSGRRGLAPPCRHGPDVGLQVDFGTAWPEDPPSPAPPNVDRICDSLPEVPGGAWGVPGCMAA